MQKINQKYQQTWFPQLQAISVYVVWQYIPIGHLLKICFSYDTEPHQIAKGCRGVGTNINCVDNSNILFGIQFVIVFNADDTFLFDEWPKELQNSLDGFS